MGQGDWHYLEATRPAPKDATFPAFLAAVLVWMAGGVLVLAAGAITTLSVTLILVAGTATGVAVWHWLEQVLRRRRSDDAAAMRTAREQETQKQLSTMGRADEKRI